MTRIAMTALLMMMIPAMSLAADDWNQVVSKAVAYLKANQNADGSWGQAPHSMGKTGVIITGLLQCGVPADDEVVAKGLKYIESLVNVKSGHIAGMDPKVGLQNYVTSVNVMALAAAGKSDKYKAIIGNAAEFLKKLQWDDGEGKAATDDFFGGAGYDSKSRPDLSNTQFFMEALVAAGVSKDDPAFKKATLFVSRCQNLKSEHNDRPWAGSINDGSFIYSAAGGGSTKTSDEANAPLTGYGSMTYAGIKSMIYAGVSQDDQRVKKAMEWVTKNYTLDANPGMPPQLAERGLYYSYVTFAKAMAAIGKDTVTDAKGLSHDWRTDLITALARRQKADGSWINSNDRWMEGDPALVTGYALMALANTKK